MGNMGDNPYRRKASTPEQLVERRLQAMKMRLEGNTWEAVAKALGVAARTCRIDVEKLMAEYMREHEAETIPRLRAKEEQRLDLILVQAYKIMNDNPGTEKALKAMDRVLRAVNIRSQLLGLNAPVEVHVTEVTQMDLELRELLQTAQAANEKTRQQLLAGEGGDGPAG